MVGPQMVEKIQISYPMCLEILKIQNLKFEVQGRKQIQDTWEARKIKKEGEKK